MDELINDKYLNKNIPDFIIQIKQQLLLNTEKYKFYKNLKYCDIRKINKNNDYFHFIYIFEPLTDIFFKKKFIQYLKKINLKKKIIFLSYCQYNCLFLEKIGVQCFFYSINYYNDKITNTDKNINLINYRSFKNSYFNNPYNSKLIKLDDINSNNLTILNHFNKDLKNIYIKTKIFINLHKKEDSKCLETFRIYELIKNRIIIISQKCELQKNELLSNFIFFEEDYNLLNKFNEINNNYDLYYNSIYNKTNKEIFQIIENENIQFLKYLSKL